MQFANLVAWFYWNPSRYAFTIPIINRPIAWYGILFVLGFILGYLIFVPIFTRYLKRSKTVTLLDVINWPLFISKITSDSLDTDPIFQQFKKKLSSSLISELKDKRTPSLPIKQELINQLNQFFVSSHMSRKELESVFSPVLASAKQTSYFIADRLCWFIVAGTLIGARLGDVFLYNWDVFKEQPWEIFKVWNGGLASHGGTVGVLLALFLFFLYLKKWTPSVSFLQLTDFIAIPTALAASFIRLGNFFNQEIVGTPTSLPWGVQFGDPWGISKHSASLPRHPVQIYEALAYFTVFILLYLLWKRFSDRLQTGSITALFFIFIFSFRFILEFWKEVQKASIDHSFLQIGQWLSLPFILLGFILLIYLVRKASNNTIFQK